MKKDEEVLMNNLLLGKELAFKDLYDQYYSSLVAYAYKMVNSLDIARELVQGVIVYIYENRSSLKITYSLKAYLYKSVYHACLKEKKTTIFTDDYEENILVEDRDLIQEAEEIAAIWDAIHSLSPQCQKVFILNRFDNLKNDEIAEKLGISKRTVETHISNALKILKGKLLNISSLILLLKI